MEVVVQRERVYAEPSNKLDPKGMRKHSRKVSGTSSEGKAHINSML